MAKKRSDNQRLEDLSRARAKEILSPFVVNDLENDFGLDLEVTLTEEGEEYQTVQPQSFYVQLKSSHDYGGGETIAEDIETDDLKFWIQQPIPVVLGAYSEVTDEIYWTIVQNHVWDNLESTNPSWRRQSTSRIRISREQVLIDLNELSTAVIDTQKRIIRRKARGLNIGEGVEFTPDDFSEMDAQIESDLLSYKGHVLEKAHELFQEGRDEEGRDLLEEVYEAPREDEGKLKSITAQVFLIDPFEPEDAFQAVELAQEGIELASELGKPGDEYYLTVQKHVAGLYVLLRKQREHLITVKIKEEAEYDLDGFEYLYQLQAKELATMQFQAIASINDALSTLLEENLYYEYAACLSPVIDYISRQLMQLISLDVVDRDALQEEPTDHPFIDQAVQLLDFLPDEELAFNLNKSLGLYYYHSLRPNAAKERLRTAIEIAQGLSDEDLTERTKEILIQVEDHPDPYEFYREDVDERSPDEVTTEEHQDMIAEVVESIGFDLSDTDDEYVRALLTGIQDADPSDYFRFCEHLRIKYWSSSMLGKATGVTSLGSKVMWCRYGGTRMGHSLEELFGGFQSEYCDGCEYHSPREDDWECTLDWVSEQEQDPEFQEVLVNIEENHPF